MNTGRLHSAIVIARITNRIVRPSVQRVTEMQRLFSTARKNRERKRNFIFRPPAPGVFIIVFAKSLPSRFEFSKKLERVQGHRERDETRDEFAVP